MDVEYEKIVAMIGLGLITFLMGIVPLKMAHYVQMKLAGGDGHTTGKPDFSAITARANAVVHNLLCFASGILLFTSILRLQPGVQKQYESLQDTHKTSSSISDLGYTMFCLGFLSFFFTDEFLHSQLNKFMIRLADWDSVVVLAQSLSLTRSNIRRLTSSVPPMTGSMPLVTILEVPEEDEDNQSTSAAEQSNTNTTGNISTDSNDNEYKETKVIFHYLFVVITLAFHEVIDGVAIGMEHDTSRVRCLFITEITHKLVIACSIGLDMAWSNVRQSVAKLYLFTFTLTMPIGIVLSMWLIDNPTQAGSMVLSFQGFGNGALFYVMVIDILTRHKKQGFPYYLLSAAFGFSLMLLVQIMSKSTMTCSTHVDLLKEHLDDSKSSLANMKIYLAIIATLILKHGVYSCSLRSHTLSHSFSDSIATPHHSSVKKLHTIPSPCSDLASDSSSSSSNILPNRSNYNEPVTPLTVLPHSTYVSSNSYNQTLVNILIKLLQSSLASTSTSTTEVTSTVSTPHFVPNPWPSSSSMPYSPVPTSTTVKTVNLGHVSKPNIVTKPCASSSSSSKSSDLSRTSCGLVSPSTISLVPSPASSTSASGINPNLVNILQKLCSLVSQPTPVSASYPLCSSLLTPKLNTNLKPVTVSKPKTIISYHSAPCSDSSSFSSSTPGLSSGQAVPLSASKAIQKTDFVNNSPWVKSQTKSVAPLVPVRAPLVPVRAPLSTLSTLSGHNSAIINYLIKLLLCTQAPIIVTSFPSTLTLSKPCSLITPKLNTTPDSTLKPETVSLVMSTIPPHSNSGSFSSVQPNFLRDSSTKLTSTPVTTPLVPISIPTSTFDISSGYNPAFIKLLIKHLLSTPSSLTPHLPPSFKLPQLIINTTTSSPSLLNPFPTSTFDGPESDLHPTVSNILLNKSSISAPFSTQVPTTIPNKSFSYNQTLINLLFKVLSVASNDIKTPITVLNSSTSSLFTNVSNSIPISTLAPSLLPKCNSSTSSSSFESSVKLSDLSPSTAVTLPSDLLPITVTPSQVLNPFAEQIRDIISPKSFLPSLSSSLCHRKHSRLSKLYSSSLSGVSPCMQTILRPLAPPLSSPCSKSTLKLRTGCKPPSSN